MGYCFMDIKKIKSLNVMAAKYKHNYREITVPNAVPELSGMNRELVPLIGKPSRLQRGVQTENGVFRVLQRPQTAE